MAYYTVESNEETRRFQFPEEAIAWAEELDHQQPARAPTLVYKWTPSEKRPEVIWPEDIIVDYY